MKWTVRFYDIKVMENLQKWPTGIKAKFTWIVELLEELGPNEIGMPHIKTLGHGLFEIRAKGNEGIGRAFFCISKERVMIILSGFIKKSQKIPLREVKLAKQRMKEVKSDG